MLAPFLHRVERVGERGDEEYANDRILTLAYLLHKYEKNERSLRRFYMPVPFRPISRVQQLLEEIGLEMTYAYQDLVFAEHNAFLLQFGKNGEDVFLHFNIESDLSKRDEIAEKLKDAGKRRELIITRKGLYSLVQTEEEKMKLTFIPQSYA